ncbi:amidohydrolase family protein [Nonomuraea sp. NPDC026600]|uniref:amidohydrolase family protein n=1 Tax=Nonomuraea sp. NPDC026600 TaxID=3155363 RepID=UPI0033EA8833
MENDTLLVRGGYVYTADENARTHPAGSVLAVNGRIVAVGETRTVDEAVAALGRRERAGMRTVDASGMMVLPGFVNAHWHEVLGRGLSQFGPRRRQPDPWCDHADVPGPFAGGGDVRLLSTTFDAAYSFADALEPEEARAIAEYSLLTQLKAGTTTFGDVGSMNKPEALIAATTRLGLRGAVSVWAGDGVCAPGESRFRRTREAAEVLDRLESVRRAAQAEGSGRIRVMPSAIYTANMSDELGDGLAAFADRHRLPFATHVAALPDETDVLRHYLGTSPVRRLADLGLLNHRLIAVHCAWPDEEEQAMLLQARVHLNHSPAKYGTTGESPMSGTRTLLRLARAGLELSLSTDGEGLPIGGMAEAMRQAWLTHNELWSDNTAIVPSTALAMATRLAAGALRWQHEIGSLQAGKRADLVLVRIDDWRYLLRPRPLEGFLLLGGSADVDTVIVDGRVLIQGGQVTHVAESAVRERFIEAAVQVAGRLFDVDRETLTRFTARFSERTRQR